MVSVCHGLPPPETVFYVLPQFPGAGSRNQGTEKGTQSAGVGT